MKPPTARPEPNSDSTVVVIETMLPSRSTTTKWEVPLASIVASAPRWIGAGMPAAGAGPGDGADQRGPAPEVVPRRAALRPEPGRTSDPRSTCPDPRTSAGSPSRTGTRPADPRARAPRCPCGRGCRASAAARRPTTAAAARRRRTRGTARRRDRTRAAGRRRNRRPRACPARGSACVRAMIASRSGGSSSARGPWLAIRPSVSAYAGLRYGSPACSGRAVGAREERAHVRLLRLLGIAVDEARHALRHRDAVPRRADRRLEQLRPGQRAVARVHRAEHRDRAGHAGRAAREDGVRVRERLAACVEEHVGRRAARRRLATVEGRDPARSTAS